MTIKNFTFFSPNGTEFPVGSNNDGKLYMMLTGMDYTTIRRKDWSNPLNTALNVQYTNTSIVAGGRYFELINETVALVANSVNYIHANIDLTKTTSPVNLSAETANNSNNVDLNNSSGVLKVLIDIRTTDGTGVIGSKVPPRVTTLDELRANSFKLPTDIPWTPFATNSGLNGQYKREFNTVTIKFDGQVTTAGTAVIGYLPTELIPASSIMTSAISFSANLTNDKHMQINGIGADQGRVAILNITANFKYAGQIKYDIG